MKKINLIKVFIASPTDVNLQRNDTENLIHEWNNEHVDEKNVVLMPIRWEGNTTSSYREGYSGQDVINQQILDDTDIMITIFGSTLGTINEEEKTSTIREIDYFYDKNRDHVGVFFVEDIPATESNHENLGRVFDFKKKLRNGRKGLYHSFGKDQIRQYITREVNSLLDSKGATKMNYDVDDFKLNFFDEMEFDEDEQLLMIFTIETENRKFGARWKSKETQMKIKEWEKEIGLNDYLSKNYEDTLKKIVDRNVLQSLEYTEDGHPRLYSLDTDLYKKMKGLIRSEIIKVNKIKNKHKSNVFKEINNLNGTLKVDELPF